MKIGIVGNGVVGQATVRVFLDCVEEIRTYDELPQRCGDSYDAALKTDLVFVCLPESQLPDFWSSVDGQSIDIVLRSTVPIGTVKRAKLDHSLHSVVHWPEFLTERFAFTDAVTPSRHIVGGSACQAREKLCSLLAMRFPGVHLFRMSSDESELVKLATNAFFATKIAFFNELHRYVTAASLSWYSVLDGILSDGRIAHSHTKVPGPDGKFGFGGRCLPKDALMFAGCLVAAGIDPMVVRAALARNLEDRRCE